MMGLIPTKWDLALCNEVTASSFCRRRLPVVMVRSKMCASVQMATKFVQQGHVRIGPEVVKDPAFLITRYFPPSSWNSKQAGITSEASDLW
jgi:U3 small nucleolar ribonucleoprotein protein IMP3